MTRDIRGPIIKRLAQSAGERLYWRWRDADDGSGEAITGEEFDRAWREVASARGDA